MKKILLTISLIFINIINAEYVYKIGVSEGMMAPPVNNEPFDCQFVSSRSNSNYRYAYYQDGSYLRVYWAGTVITNNGSLTESTIYNGYEYKSGDYMGVDGGLDWWQICRRPTL